MSNDIISFFGRYLKVEFPELNRSFLSNFDKDEYGNKAPRIKVQVNMQKNAFTQGKISIYGLNANTRKELETKNYSVNIYAGWANKGNSQIVKADKKFFEVIRVGADLITNIYFLSIGIDAKAGTQVKSSSLQSLIRQQVETFGGTVVFKNNNLASTSVSNITLTGNIQNRMKKLENLFDFNYYEQNGNFVVSDGVISEDEDFIEIKTTDGLLSIPSYSRAGRKVDFKIMLNNDIKIGTVFKITNTYKRISIGDLTKTFAGDLISDSLSNIEDVKFRVLDINYNLDTMGDNFNMSIEGLIYVKS